MLTALSIRENNTKKITGLDIKKAKVWQLSKDVFSLRDEKERDAMIREGAPNDNPKMRLIGSISPCIR